MLIHTTSGGMVAAPTTSLPELIGGTRNWDYRFCWPRDTGRGVLALASAGHTDELKDWIGWLDRIVGDSPRPLYGVDGERLVPERDIAWLPGFQGSKPVRVGNEAATQFQLDTFGEIEIARHSAIDLGLVAPDRDWGQRCALIERLLKCRHDPDEGIWEVRGGPQHFTWSKAMAWAAFDRAIDTAERFDLKAPLDRWRQARSEIFHLVLDHGFNKALGSFTLTLDGDTIDASPLLLPSIGFLEPNDPRMVSTVAAIGRELMYDGLIRRYHTHETPDGLPPGEGMFLACSFWYASMLSLQGRHAEAVELFERLLATCNDVGLLSEEYDPENRCHLGNFPQGFSHFALVTTALTLDGVESSR